MHLTSPQAGSDKRSVTITSVGRPKPTSTRMSFRSVGASSPTICRHLYLLARRRKSWNRPVCEVPRKPLNLDPVPPRAEETFLKGERKKQAGC